jgi:glycosyltransferase involved in cell wall biosynthesis
VPPIRSAEARYAVVLTHNRPALLAECVTAVAAQVDMVVVIDNASDPPAGVPLGLTNVVLVYDPGQPPNLARLWNRGFDAITRHRGADVTAWDVAVLCDDATIPAGWVGMVSATMRGCGAVAGSTHSITPLPASLVKTAPDADIHNRMCGWAFLLAGEARLRADENMHWWWCDSDLDQQARLAGGMAIAPGPVVPNGRPNDFTYSVPGLADQARRDREAYAVKWGGCPW